MRVEQQFPAPGDLFASREFSDVWQNFLGAPDPHVADHRLKPLRALALKVHWPANLTDSGFYGFIGLSEKAIAQICAIIPAHSRLMMLASIQISTCSIHRLRRKVMDFILGRRYKNTEVIL